MDDPDRKILALLVEPIIGKGFIHPVASRTLRCMKAYLEKQHG